MFQDLKLRKKHRYVIYRLSDDNRAIVVEKVVEKDAKYDDFVAGLPEDDCRYAVYDFEYQKSPEEGSRSKICFVVWYCCACAPCDLTCRAPDTAKVKQKMLYASSKDALRKKLVGIGTEVQATDASEVAFEAVLEKVRAI